MRPLFGSNKHPKGPSWSSAREHYLDLSGSRFYFTVPAHTDPISSFKPEPETYNLYDASRYWKLSKSNNPASTLEGGFSSGWQFKGFPLFGEIGCLDFGIFITHEPSFGSLYRPEHFLGALNQRLNYNYGPLSGMAKGRFQLRKNWSIQAIGPTPFAYYEKFESLDSSRYWETPISDEHCITFVFHKETHKDAVAHIGFNNAYDALIAKIIASLRIEWSADARAQQAAAKQKWPGETLPAVLPELIWSDEEWRAAESKRDKEYQELVEAANAESTPKPADMDERGDLHA